MSKPFHELVSDMRQFFDEFGVYVENATIMPRTRGALRDLHSKGVRIANDLQNRASDVSTCDRLTALESEVASMRSDIRTLVKSDTEVHETLEQVAKAEAVEAVQEAIETSDVAALATAAKELETIDAPINDQTSSV